MKTKYIILTFFLFGVVTRFPLIENMQSHWDGPQYSIGIVSYDLSQETPAPPGYPVYLFLGWLTNHIFSDPHHSLLIVGVIFSGITGAAFYLAGKYLFSTSTGVISGLLYLSSPVYYFFGLTAYPYGLISVFVLFAAVVVYEIILRKKNYGMLLGLSYGVFCGIRPQDGLSLLPLIIFGFLSLKNLREKIKSILVFLISVLVWFMPLVLVSGGVVEYYSQFVKFIGSGALEPVKGGTGENIRRIVKGLFLSLGIASFFLIYFPPRVLIWLKRKATRKKAIFFLLWIIPGLLSATFVRNDHSGYQMVYMTPLVVLASYSIDKFTRNMRLRHVLIAGVIIFNIFWFFRDRDPAFAGPYVQTSFHYSEIRKNDTEMKEKIEFIESEFDPSKTVVVVDAQHFRPVMYHLPKYEVVSLSSLETSDSKQSCHVRRGKNWLRTEYVSCNNTISFPGNIEKIIFFDNNASGFVETEKILHRLKNNMSILETENTENGQFQYNYKNFRKE